MACLGLFLSCSSVAMKRKTLPGSTRCNHDSLCVGTAMMRNYRDQYTCSEANQSAKPHLPYKY